MIADQTKRTSGVLRAGELGVQEGDAMYWDDAVPALLGTCGVNDHYRYAGQALIIGITTNANNWLADDGDTIVVDRYGVRAAYGDGVATYLRGRPLTTGALGTLVPYIGKKRFEHPVTGAEAAANQITLPAHVGSIISMRNENLNIDFIVGDEDATPDAGVVTVSNADPIVLDFFAGEITNGDQLNYTYVPKNGKVAVVEIAPDANNKMYVQTSGGM